MAMMKIIALVDHEAQQTRAAAVHDLEMVQTQIIAKINEIMLVCVQLREDVDELQEKPAILN
jgi:hypothetical protein